MAKQKRLSVKLAKELEALWELGGENTLTDAEIAARLEIGADRLRGWLYRNSKVVIGVDGAGNNIKEGVRDIRTRARGQTKSSYLQRLYNITLEAERAKDYRVASSNMMWLLEKMFPKDFGNRIRLDEGGDQDMSKLSDEDLEKELEKSLREISGRPACKSLLQKHSEG
ncbi:hypothetical protein KAR91_37680 [Candidatus Pacearchaeota archaeon]|nr:hypothetical protein [Candidatus Pacearchaeota archaeon]